MTPQEKETAFSAVAGEVIAVCAKHEMNWLDILFLFGVIARGLTNTCPLPPEVSEREALKAYMAGNTSDVIVTTKGTKH